MPGRDFGPIYGIMIFWPSAIILCLIFDCLNIFGAWTFFSFLLISWPPDSIWRFGPFSASSGNSHRKTFYSFTGASYSKRVSSKAITMSVAFWSATVSDGKPFTVQPLEGYVLNLQQAALINCDAKSSVVLRAQSISIEGEKMDAVLGTLRVITQDQFSMGELQVKGNLEVLSV